MASASWHVRLNYVTAGHLESHRGYCHHLLSVMPESLRAYCKYNLSPWWQHATHTLYSSLASAGLF